eukprot:gene7258-8027_t
MNIKAERIEQLIQLLNRNLLLIFSGQVDGTTPLENKRLQKVDAVIFGHDKFAFEMIHFVASASDKLLNNGTIFGKWEECFVRGLESLLVECAVIHDDIERDCFVSRVYCWFTEKLVERREVPRQDLVELHSLRDSVVRLAGQETHAAKAIESYSPNRSPDHRASLLPDSPSWQAKEDREEEKGLLLPAVHSSQPLQVGLWPGSGGPTIAHRLPLYVKHSRPSILHSKELSEGLTLPSIPTAQQNYGLLHSKPETDAEKNMNELWLARRRQEAFQFKTQQQLAVVMDRLALHKSRLESDALRRQETSSILITRPSSAGARLRTTDDHSPPRSRVQSAAERGRPPRGIQSKLCLFSNEDSPNSSPERQRSSQVEFGGSRQILKDGTERNGNLGGPDNMTSVVVAGQDFEKETTIVRASRASVMKTSKKEFVPMRFKIDIPEGYGTDKSKYFSQLSDSSDEDDEAVEHNPKTLMTTQPVSSAGATKKKAAAGRSEVTFKRQKPPNRERPSSAKLFRAVATNDAEFKVLYRHTNYRRMPMTLEQERWLDEREAERCKLSEAVAKQLVAEVQRKGDKKKGKDKGKAGKGEKEQKRNNSAPSHMPNSKDIHKPKYKTASQFMAIHFPQFENEHDQHTMGPMRAIQLSEVEDVMESCGRHHITIKEAAIRKALVIPQDKPEALCLEGLREGSEALMVNPKPQELWRKFVAAKKGKGKKKRG